MSTASRLLLYRQKLLDKAEDIDIGSIIIFYLDYNGVWAATKDFIILDRHIYWKSFKAGYSADYLSYGYSLNNGYKRGYYYASTIVSKRSRDYKAITVLLSL